MHNNNNSVVKLFHHLEDAENAARILRNNGYDMKKLSIIDIGESDIDYCDANDYTGIWAEYGLFGGWIWAILFGFACLIVLGGSPITLDDSLMSSIINALGMATIVGGCFAICGVLSDVENPNAHVLRCQTAIKSSKFMLVVRGTEREAAAAEDILM